MKITHRSIIIALLLAASATASAAAAAGAVSQGHSQVLAGRILSCRLSDRPAVLVQPVTESGPSSLDAQQASLDGAGFFLLQVRQKGVYRVLVTEPGGDPLVAIVPVTHLTVIPPTYSPACRQHPAAPWHSVQEFLPSSLPETHITGRVFEMNQERTPLADAWIWTSSPYPRAVRADEKGNYRLPYLRSGKFLLWAHAEGYQDIGVPTRTDGGDPSIIGPTFPLTRISYLSGQVRDPDGNSKPARIEAVRIKEASRRADTLASKALTAYTDRQGRFYLSVDPMTRYRLSVTTDDSQKAEISVFTARAGEIAPELEIQLEAPVSATGRLIDPEGLPVDGAVVTLLPGEALEDRLSALAGRLSSAERYPSALTDRAGRFQVEGLRHGRYDLVATRAGFAPLAGPSVAVTSGDVDFGTLFLSKGAEIEGWVEDLDGKPLAKAEIGVGLMGRGGHRIVSSSKERALSDERGWFSLHNLPSDEQIRLSIYRPGYLPKALTVGTSSSEALVVTLLPAGGVTGIVLDEHREPVAGARVSVRPNSASSSEVRRIGASGGAPNFSVTDKAGRFEIHDVETGPSTLFVSATGHLPGRVAVTVPRDDVAEGIEVVLSTGATLTGRVMLAAGDPVENARISAAGQTARSTSDGQFKLRGLPSGRLTVSAVHPQLGTQTSEADTSSPRPIELIFRPSAVLEIQASNEEGLALADVQVSTTGGSSPFPRFGRTDSTGNVRFSLEPGLYTITGRKPGYVPATLAAVKLDSKDHLTERIELRAGLAVFGTINGADAAQLVRAEIVAVQPARPAVRGTMDTAGRYRIGGLEPGTWLVVATLPDGRRAETMADLDGSSPFVKADLELGAGRDLRGRASIDGEPLSGAWIAISTLAGTVLARTQTEADGAFHVAGLSESRVQVDLSTPAGDLRVSLPARVGDEVEIALRTGNVSGMVLDATTGGPVQGAGVLFAPMADSTLLKRRVRTDPDGRFGPVQLPEARYRVSVEHPGYIVGTAEVAVGGPEQRLTLALAPTP